MRNKPWLPTTVLAFALGLTLTACGSDDPVTDARAEGAATSAPSASPSETA